MVLIPLAMTFLAMSCSVMIPTMDVPSIITSELISLCAILQAQSWMDSLGAETTTFSAIISLTLYLPSMFLLGGGCLY